MTKRKRRRSEGGHFELKRTVRLYSAKKEKKKNDHNAK